jgi:hypothetical protein
MIPDSHLQAALAMFGLTGETTRCTLSGDCMAPTLRAGDTLLIKLGSRDIRVGDIVVFGSCGDLRVHRVVRIWSQGGADVVSVATDLEGELQPALLGDEILGRVIEACGANGRIRFDSFLWRSLNRLLSLRSDVSLRRREAKTVRWRMVNAIFKLRDRVLPRRYSISLLPIRLLLWINGKARTARLRFRPGRAAEG